MLFIFPLHTNHDPNSKYNTWWYPTPILLTIWIALLFPHPYVWLFSLLGCWFIILILLRFGIKNQPAEKRENIVGSTYIFSAILSVCSLAILVIKYFVSLADV